MKKELSTRRALAIALTVIATLAPVAASADHRGHDRGRHEGWRRQECSRPVRRVAYYDPYAYRPVVYRPRYVCHDRYERVDYHDRPGVTLTIRF